MLFGKDTCFIPGNDKVFLSCLVEIRESRSNHVTVGERVRTNILVMTKPSVEVLENGTLGKERKTHCGENNDKTSL